jgi:hypothetical protein
VKGTVAVGDTYKFTFDLHAPDKPGTYYEYFNLVEEGVAWFSDPGQGGPPDNDLEVQIVVEAAPDAGIEPTMRARSTTTRVRSRTRVTRTPEARTQVRRARPIPRPRVRPGS